MADILSFMATMTQTHIQGGNAAASKSHQNFGPVSFIHHGHGLFYLDD
jgi:hypothetical protein